MFTEIMAKILFKYNENYKHTVKKFKHQKNKNKEICTETYHNQIATAH